MSGATPTARPTAVVMDQIQINALQVLWNAMNSFSGSPGSQISSWKNCQRPWNFLGNPVFTGAVVCQWCGIQCDQNTPPNIQGLNLANMNLNGVIPTNIGDLSALTLLQLSGNRITGEIPDTISRMAGLATLDLSNNFISGTLPAQLGNLYSLRWFKVQNTLIKNQVPRSYCNLVKVGVLQGLWITGDGGLSCYPSCLLSGQSPNVVSADPSLPVCGQSGSGSASTVTISQTDDQQTIAIAAGVAGGVIGLLCIIGVVCLLLRSKRKRAESESGTKVVVINNKGEANAAATKKGKAGQSPAQARAQALAKARAGRGRGQAGKGGQYDEGDEEEDEDEEEEDNDEEVGSPMHRGPPPPPPQQPINTSNSGPKPMLRPLPLASNKLGQRQSSLAPAAASRLQMQIELQNVTAPEQAPEEGGSNASIQSNTGIFQQKRFTLKPMAGGGQTGASPPRPPTKPGQTTTSGAQPPPPPPAPPGPQRLEGHEEGSEGSGSRGSGGSQGGAGGHGDYDDDDERASDYSGDSGNENKMERPTPTPTAEQRFMMGANPMAGRRLGADREADQDQRRPSGMPRGPIVPRTPEQQPQPRRQSTMPSNLAIRPEMQEAALSQAKRFNMLGAPPRPPAPPRR